MVWVPTRYRAYFQHDKRTPDVVNHAHVTGINPPAVIFLLAFPIA